MIECFIIYCHYARKLFQARKLGGPELISLKKAPHLRIHEPEVLAGVANDLWAGIGQISSWSRPVALPKHSLYFSRISQTKTSMNGHLINYLS